MRIDTKYCLAWSDGLLGDGSPGDRHTHDCTHLVVRIEGEYGTIMFRCRRQANIALGRTGGEANRNDWCFSNPPYAEMERG